MSPEGGKGGGDSLGDALLVCGVGHRGGVRGKLQHDGGAGEVIEGWNGGEEQGDGNSGA